MSLWQPLWEPANPETATDLLNDIKTVDGSGSGLDADKLDGHEASYFAIDGSPSSTNAVVIAAQAFFANYFGAL